MGAVLRGLAAGRRANGLKELDARRPGLSYRAIREEETMKILVATDGSRGGSAAVRQAGRLAAAMRPRASVTVIMVGTVTRQLVLGSSGEPYAFTALPGLERLERGHAALVLAAAVRRLRKAGVPAVSRFVSPRDLARVDEAILREADRVGAGLVVIGNEGHGAIRELALGSVALSLLNRSRRPILVVRPPRGAR